MHYTRTLLSRITRELGPTMYGAVIHTRRLQTWWEAARAGQQGQAGAGEWNARGRAGSTKGRGR